jgi:molecular chaperone DnaK
MPAGVPQVEITYDIDANGILHVTAKEKSTGKEASITIQNTTTLSDDEVERMVAAAKANADVDRKLKETAEARNMLDGMRNQAQNTLDESEADDAAKQAVKDVISEAESALTNDSTSKERFEELGTKLSEAVTAFMQANPAASATDAAAGAAQAADDEDVIDADFKPAG